MLLLFYVVCYNFNHCSLFKNQILVSRKEKNKINGQTHNTNKMSTDLK